MSSLYFGTFIHSKSLKQLEILVNHVMKVTKDGKLSLYSQKVFDTLDQTEFSSSKKVFLKKSQFMIPGFIDTHTHAPQYLNAGLGTDLPLLDWLIKYTFPQETKFKDNEFAQHAYTTTVSRFIKNGTTTCAYYGTIHLEASLTLSRIVKKLGQRGFIGKVCMDRNSPDTYIEKTHESLIATEDFIKQVLSESEGLTTPIITPRFAPTCTNELMKGLGDLSEKYKVPIQTHLSENKAELMWVSELHPDQKTYTDVYNSVGLLTERTILGHSIFLSQKELELIKAKKSSLSHCPLSNFTLGSGLMDMRRILKNEIKVSLGTDCSGGYSTSMLSSIRNAIISSHCVHIHHRDEKSIEKEVEKIHDKKTTISLEEFKPLEFYESFYLATAGGAECLGLKDTVGNFENGKEFDALLIDVSAKDTPIDAFIKDDLNEEAYREMFQRFLFNGDDRNIVQIFVRGVSILEK
jgi:guanine deaminase